MDKELAEAIVEAIDEIGGEAKIYEHYLGCGMFGKVTTGVSIRGSFFS